MLAAANADGPVFCVRDVHVVSVVIVLSMIKNNKAKLLSMENKLGGYFKGDDKLNELSACIYYSTKYCGRLLISLLLVGFSHLSYLQFWNTENMLAS